MLDQNPQNVEAGPPYPSIYIYIYERRRLLLWFLSWSLSKFTALPFESTKLNDADGSEQCSTAHSEDKKARPHNTTMKLLVTCEISLAGNSGWQLLHTLTLTALSHLTISTYQPSCTCQSSSEKLLQIPKTVKTNI